MKQVISVLLLVVVVLSGTSFAASETRVSGTVSGRIVGGSNATINNYPFMLRMFLEVSTNTYTVCGASVIGPYHALTAAHCFFSKTVKSIYFLGRSTNQSSVYTGKNHTVHPGFNPTNRDNDAAVVQITTSFFSNPLIKSIPLQNTEPVASTSCYVLGWGYTTPTGSPSDILQLGNYSLQPLSYCESVYGKGEMTSQMYCASATKGRACFGDSGGPLVCGGRQHGIVSFGKNQCEANVAEGFAKVPSASIRNFIRHVSGI